MPAATRLLVTVVASLAAGVALAQAPAGSGAAGAAAAPQVQSANGIDYVNGGAGEEARAAMAALQSGFALRLVFSETTGAYVVADEVRIRRGSSDVLTVRAAGPMLLARLQPGSYTVEASYAGKVERRQVQLGGQPVTLHWRWSPAAGASTPR